MADIDEEAAIAIGDDDVFEIDFDEEIAEPIAVPAAEARPRPAAGRHPLPATQARPLPEAAEGDQDLGEDAVADFLMNLEIDDETIRRRSDSQATSCPALRRMQRSLTIAVRL